MKKKLLFLCGPNSIGKATVSKRVVELRPGTACVDSAPCRFMNPFTLNDETIPTIAKNLSDLIGNFMDCPLVDTVIFTYGFHGRRREVFERVLANLHDRGYRFLPPSYGAAKKRICAEAGWMAGMKRGYVVG